MNLLQIIAIIAIVVIVLSIIAYGLTHRETKPTQFSPTKAERYSLLRDLDAIDRMQRQQFQSPRNPTGKPSAPPTFKPGKY